MYWSHRRNRRGEQGFTLIELLVVIVILGLLASVVVFAVRGVGDKGKGSAVEIDERTIRTAQESYCGAKGSYGSGQQLVDAGFLSELPTYHQVDVQATGGPCNGSKFTILRTSQAGDNPPGRWDLVAPPGIAFTVYLVRLADGRVLAGGDDGTGAWVTKIWDPATDAWAATGSPPDLPSRGNTAVLLTDDPLTPQNECKSATADNCGKVFLYGKYLFDPKVTAVGPGQWERLPSPPDCRICNSGPSNFTSDFSFVQMKRSVGQCSPNCGKILIFPAVSPAVVEIFDPSDNSFETQSIDQDPGAGGNYVVQLSDGRLLVCCADAAGSTPKASFFDPVSRAYSGDAAIPPGSGWRRENAQQPGPVLPNGDHLFVGLINFPLESGVYTPQSAPGIGSFRSPSPENCILGPPYFCSLIGALPDGRVLAHADDTAETYVFNPATAKWSRSGDLNNSASHKKVSVLLDAAGGVCGSYCGKLLVAGANSAEVYTVSN